jgi:hypothetical protein
LESLGGLICTIEREYLGFKSKYFCFHSASIGERSKESMGGREKEWRRKRRGRREGEAILFIILFHFPKS